MHPLRTVIRCFDEWLSRREGVAPFTDDPAIIMRLQTASLAHTLILPDRTVPATAKALWLHFWNERMPAIPDTGPDLAYGIKLHKLMMASAKSIARHIRETPSLQDIQVIGGVTAHASLKKADGGRAMLEHFGFTIMPYHHTLGAFGEFWENFYTWWVMWTYNPATIRHRNIWNLQRIEFWMTKERFLEKYG